MARRAHLVVALVMALIGLASLPVAAQSGRTFYIDYASGSNSNPGTKSSPWKTHPYMRTGAACTTSGLSAAYSHQAGDHFIFKGGDTWPAACLPLVISSGGSLASSVSGAGAAPTINGADYYGVDETWYSGGSFAKPVFDAQGTTPAGLYGAIVEVTANYVTLDDLEMKNALQGAVIFAGCTRGSIDLENSANVVMDRLYIHDWSIGSLANQDGSWHATASICGNVSTGSYTDKVYNTEMSDAAQPAGSQFGTCFIGLGEVAYSNCHNVAEGQLYSFGPTHDNYFHDFDGTTAMAPSGAHSNGIESGNIAEPSAFYNNYMYNLDVGYNEICPGTAVYNNVFSKIFNSGAGAGQELAVDAGDPGCSSAPATTQTYIYNNTFDAGQAGGSYSTLRLTVRSTQQGVVTLKNNISIGGSFDLSGATQTPVQSNNYTMSTSEATTYGFTPANKYASTSSDPNVEGQGVNLLSSNLLSSLSASLINVLQPLAQDPEGAPWFGESYIARGATWDLGAYVFGGQSSSGTSKPNPPTNLTATVQ